LYLPSAVFCICLQLAAYGLQLYLLSALGFKLSAVFVFGCSAFSIARLALSCICLQLYFICLQLAAYGLQLYLLSALGFKLSAVFAFMPRCLVALFPVTTTVVSRYF
jgi:hypothetical protein